MAWPVVMKTPEEMFKPASTVAQHKTGLKVLVYGKEDTMKTGFALSFPPPVYIFDTELGSPPLFQYFTEKQPDGTTKMKDIRWCDATYPVPEQALAIYIWSENICCGATIGRSKQSMVSCTNRWRRDYYCMQGKRNRNSSTNRYRKQESSVIRKGTFPCSRTICLHKQRNVLAICHHKLVCTRESLSGYSALCDSKEVASRVTASILRVTKAACKNRKKCHKVLYGRRAKTSGTNLFAKQWKKTRLVSKKASRNRSRILNPETGLHDASVCLQRLESGIALLRDIKQGTIVIDSGTDVWDWIQEWLNEVGRHKEDQLLRFEWAKAKLKWKKLLLQLMAKPIHFVMTAQPQEIYANREPTGTYRARIQGESAHSFDIVLHAMRWETLDPKNPLVKTVQYKTEVTKCRFKKGWRPTFDDIGIQGFEKLTKQLKEDLGVEVW